MSRQPVEPDEEELGPNYWLPFTLLFSAAMLAAGWSYVRAFLSAFVS